MTMKFFRLTYILLIFIFLAFIISSCNKEKTNWDVDVLIPLINADLSMKNLVEEENISLDDDSTVKFVINNSLFDFNPSELAEIPDTSFSESFAIPVPGAVSFPPGSIIFQNTSTNSFNTSGVTLNKVVLREGRSIIKLKSNVQGRLRVRYTLPKVSRNGQIFVAEEIMPAAPSGGESEINRTLDLNGYWFDLTGADGQSANVFNAQIEIFVSDDASGDVTIGGGNVVSVENTLQGVVPRYARGYFGSESINSGADTSNFDIFKNIVDGTFELDKMRLNFTVKNGTGVDGSIKINQLSGNNTRNGNSVNLNHSIVGSTFNINRATDRFDFPEKVIPTERSFTIDDQNSNVLDFIQLLPDQLIYDIDIITNPLGNVSGGNDFLDIDNGLSINLDAEIPLNFFANNLTFVDTIDLDIEEDLKDLKNVELNVFVENGLPLATDLQLYMLNESNIVLDSVSIEKINIPAGNLDGNNFVVSPNSSVSKIVLNEAKTNTLKETKKIMIQAAFSTPLNNQKVRILEKDRIKVKVGAKALYNVNL